MMKDVVDLGDVERWYFAFGLLVEGLLVLDLDLCDDERGDV